MILVDILNCIICVKEKEQINLKIKKWVGRFTSFGTQKYHEYGMAIQRCDYIKR
jgi:hypothetical protein